MVVLNTTALLALEGGWNLFLFLFFLNAKTEAVLQSEVFYTHVLAYSSIIRLVLKGNSKKQKKLQISLYKTLALKAIN